MSPKQYPVIDAKSAIKNHNKQLEGFKGIEARMAQAQVNRMPMPSDGQPTLDDFLAQNSLPQTFAVKSALAKKVGINDYVGKPEQDKQIMMAMESINAKETEAKGKESEDKNKDREFGLKEKELSLKEKEIEAKKMPDASSIADQIMNKFNQQ
jgi:hypothetical protein